MLTGQPPAQASTRHDWATFGLPSLSHGFLSPQLAPDDAWRCPHCQVLQQGMVKLSLWTLPDILIIHLKRFRQVGERRHKLSTLVQFPLCGLDMAPHVAKRSQTGQHVLGQWAAWKQPPYLPESCQLDYLYDLYAVCNHHGSMQGGHYTGECALVVCRVVAIPVSAPWQCSGQALYR